MSRRLIVTGVNGQVARALAATPSPGFDVLPLARPELDLADPDSVHRALATARPEVIVHAAAYTAVDRAEAERAEAFAINETGACAVAEAAARLGAPLIFYSTDYVFDGLKAAPYAESDATKPINAYGESKLAGERAIAETTADHVILRVSWVYSPYGQNFVRTMLRLAESRDEIAVVDDQRGCPTSALDIADATFEIATHLLNDAKHGRGLFHLGASDALTWADFAEAIFAESAQRGGPSARVRRIPSAQYPTSARRPANSLLDGALLQATHGVGAPPWRASLATCIDRLLASGQKVG